MEEEKEVDEIEMALKGVPEDYKELSSDQVQRVPSDAENHFER